MSRPQPNRLADRLADNERSHQSLDVPHTGSIPAGRGPWPREQKPDDTPGDKGTDLIPKEVA